MSEIPLANGLYIKRVDILCVMPQDSRSKLHRSIKTPLIHMSARLF